MATPLTQQNVVQFIILNIVQCSVCRDGLTVRLSRLQPGGPAFWGFRDAIRIGSVRLGQIRFD